ncbi:MAG: energy transducer TonB, partial [Bacteroidetes bacterium]|nr:energy transducer TonB [Bacteroidota bacterium]
LRRAYNKFVTRAIIISVIALFLAAIIPFLIFKEASSRTITKEAGAEFTNLEKPPEDAPPPPPPPPPPAEIEQKVKFTAPVVTTDTVEDTGMLNQDDLNKASTNTAPITEDQEIIVEDNKNEVIEQAAPILTIVELPPTFNGGEEALYKWLANNIKYPQIAKETGITGTVYVTFVVERDGSISNVALLKGIGGGCDDEALRVIKIMPKWNIGKQNGVPVRVQFNLPIRFTLE